MDKQATPEEWNRLRRQGLKTTPKITTMAMDYDSVSQGLRDTYDELYDYVRYREMELLAEQLAYYDVEGAVAEAGVDMGDTSAFLNRLFPDRKLFLYDTFDRFPQESLDIEVERFGADSTLADRWEGIRPDSDTRIQYIRSHLDHEEMVCFRKGFFPETAKKNDAEETFAFVLLDMDLYQPMLDGIFFFYPRLVSGGIMMLHDYNTSLFEGTKAAVKEAEKTFGRFCRIPLPDQGGSLVIIKHQPEVFSHT